MFFNRALFTNKLIFFLGLILILLKILFIEIDPPAWNLSFYQPIDEAYYVYPAYNFFETSNLFGKDNPMVFGNPILTNLLTYFSLEILGDNYFGLRISSIIFALISYCFLFFLICKWVQNLYIKVAAIILFSINFTFTTASLIVEPSIARMATALIALWLILTWINDKNAKNLIWQAAILSSLFLYSYPTNAFVVFSGYLLLVFYQIRTIRNKKKFAFLIVKRNLYYGLGCLGSLFIFIYFSQLLGTNIFENSINRGSAYEGRVAFDIFKISINFFKLETANFFRLNPLMLIIFLMIIGSGVPLLRFKKDIQFIKVVGVFILAFVLQSLFINDFAQRKLIVIFPFLILISAFILDKIFQEKPNFSPSLLLINLLISFVGLLVLVYLERDFYQENTYLLYIAGIGFLLLNLILLKPKKGLVYVLFFVLMIPEVYHIGNHYLVKRPTYYKSANKKLEKYNGVEFLGGFSMGFRTYNKIEPSLNMYLYYNDMPTFWHKINLLSINGKKDYSIGYAHQIEKFKNIGFKPAEVLMFAKETVANKDILIFEEIEVN